MISRIFQKRNVKIEQSEQFEELSSIAKALKAKLVNASDDDANKINKNYSGK